MKSLPRLLTLTALLVPFLVTPLARADVAAAEVLFQEGKKLLAAGKVAEACEKLAASQKLDPSSGTLLNLADCRLKEGKVATAWATFLSASTLAKSQGNPGRASEATKRAAEVEQRLSYLTFQLASRPAGLVIKRNNEPIELAALDTRIPVDPGSHRFTASAPGFEEWSGTIEVTQPGVQEVKIPALKKSKDPPPGPTTTATGAPTSGGPSAPSGRSPTAGYVVGGLGLVVTGVGAYFGLRSLGAYKDAEDLCKTHKNCPEAARDPSEDATRSGTIATIGMGVGLVGVAAGAYLILTARGGKGEARWRLSPQIGAGYQGAALGGRF